MKAWLLWRIVVSRHQSSSPVLCAWKCIKLTPLRHMLLHVGKVQEMRCWIGLLSLKNKQQCLDHPEVAQQLQKSGSLFRILPGPYLSFEMMF
ncbi:hypothetical protein CgunFtcFv8_016293 [Champsocephalus gunnari]|uniref:Uncharacterized protein n=1 Tax=Champsocephalus gunnari TaxID=52237 RepID=A0AAN8CQK2_CHAGU|nr:hypothetical protein CgunFtcFv8_016293 [Champsocephalus gunnari]